MKRYLLAGLFSVLAAGPAAAEVIGTNTPAPALTHERVEALPKAQQGMWWVYLAWSESGMQMDRATLAAELEPGQAAPPPPAAGKSHMPLDRPEDWYGSAEARAIADTIVSFQTPTGGWSKNQDRTGPKRLPGQRYANNAETMEVGTGNFDAPADRFWTFVGSLDNGATTTEMRFLARVQQQTPGVAGEAYRDSLIRGVKYLLIAQYPNGGWPQNYPLEGGFHDGVTFNDNAVAEAAMLLADIAEGRPEFAFVPKDLRKQAGWASVRAVDVILAAQVVVDGRRTIWPQQVDALTLEPISARNYEMPSLATAETADILLFLMRQPDPSPELREAVHAGVAWLKDHAMYDLAWEFGTEEEGRRAVASPGAGPIWARFYDIRTGKPIFGDKDKTIHDDVNGISKERRKNYAWYGTAPQKAIEAYEDWKVQNP